MLFSSGLVFLIMAGAAGAAGAAAEEQHPRCLVWIATLDSLKVGGRRTNINMEARTTKLDRDVCQLRRVLRNRDAQEDDEDDEIVEDAKPQAQVVGIALVDLVGVYHRMRPLDPAERSQLRFWQETLENELHGEAYHFAIVNSVALPSPEPLQHFGTGSFRGLTLHLELGQPERLRADLPHDIPWLPDDVPTVALRMPFQHALLAANSEITGWTSIVLPHQVGRGRGGTYSSCINFKMLGIHPHELPRLPAIEFFEFERGALDMDQDEVVSILNRLHEYGGYFDTDNIIERADHMHLQRSVAIMQALHDEMDSVSFYKTIKELTGKVPWGPPLQ